MANFQSDEHALVSGAVFGALMTCEERIGAVMSPGAPAKVMPDADEDNNYLPSGTITLTGESGREYVFRIRIEEANDE